VVGSTCQDTTPSTGQCNEWQYTYQCQTQAAQTQQQLSCAGGIIGPTIATPSNPNKTFAQAAVAQEILNEGATYNNKGILFGGVQETCTKGDVGIHNCCKSSPGAKTNGQVMNIAVGAAASVVKYAGSAAIDWASPYVYDAMYSNGIWTNGMASGMGTNLAASGFSLGAYGFTYSTVAVAQGSGFMGGATPLFGNASSGYMSFNPYVFAAMVVISYLESLSSCTSQEQLLAMHKGAGLSTYISETCSSSMLGLSSMCTDTYCSFNSVLAEIINIQGKTQLGLSIANCQGITSAQLSQIDFTKVNFSAFTQSLLQNAQNGSPTSSSMSSGYSPILQNATSGSSQNARSSALPAYH
jgi:conjugal transfer mating pair stabilization protein TraN